MFFSARPDEEHHEFVLQRGRTAPPGAKLSHQVSWRIDSLETILAFHKRFKDEGVKVQQEVTHGNAIGIYFLDLEGNRNEVYLRLEDDVRQPFRKTLNLDQAPPRAVDQVRCSAAVVSGIHTITRVVAWACTGFCV